MCSGIFIMQTMTAYWLVNLMSLDHVKYSHIVSFNKSIQLICESPSDPLTPNELTAPAKQITHKAQLSTAVAKSITKLARNGSIVLNNSSQNVSI